MSALQNLNAAILNLTAVVATAIPDIPPPGSGATEAQVQTAADAVNAQANVLQTAITGVTGTVPAAPTALVADASKPGSVLLSFTASPGAVSYSIKRSTTTGLEATIGTATSPTFTDTVTVGQGALFYVVTAVNATGESAPSNEVTVTV